MSDTTRTIPKAAEFAERIKQIFSDLSFQIQYKTVLTEMALEESFNENVKVEALLSAAIEKSSTSHELLFVNLEDVVTLLLERVKELES